MEPKGIVAASAPQWIRVKDALPEQNKRVLTWDRILGAVINVWLGDKWIYGNKRISHWMPMPEPPKEDIASGNEK